MNRGVKVGRRSTSTGRSTGRSTGLFLSALLAAVIGLAGCQAKTGAAGSAPAGGSSVPAGKAGAQVGIVPINGATAVGLNKPVKVKVAQGKISTVSVTATSGTLLTGSLAADQASWTSQGRLAPNTTYRVSIAAVATNGRRTTVSSSFRTLSPKGTVTASIQPSSGLTVGVGMPVIVNFSQSVATRDRSGVESGLVVSTPGHVEGAWHWMTAQQVQWRPKQYWPAHSTVKVTADLAGVEIRPGVWGTTQKHISNFAIGSAMISTVDVSAHKMFVREDGRLLRVIPVTTGKAGMATRNGVKVIMSRETEHRMDSTTIGIKEGQPGYYNIVAQYAMRLTYSGEFLHAAPWSAGAQGHTNVSHGCTGMTVAQSRWLFNQSKVGDVVVFKHSTRSLEWGNGYTLWNESYSQWKKA